MTDSDAPAATTNPPESVSPGAAFGLLASETRVAILRALWEARREGPVGFSALRERVGVSDSGGFNYHLGKLTGHFVRKTGDGYVLRYAGAALVGAIVAGTLDHAGFDEPVPVGAACPECDGDLRMTYESERATIACEDCETVIATASLPSGVFADREDEDAPETFDRWLRAQVETVAAGFCMSCQGPTAGRVELGASSHESYGGEDEAFAHYECGRCGDSVLATVPEALLTHPAVVSFCYDHGVDVRETPTWELSWVRDDPEIVSEDPLRVRVTVEMGGERLAVVVDDALSVVETERTALD